MKWISVLSLFACLTTVASSTVQQQTTVDKDDKNLRGPENERELYYKHYYYSKSGKSGKGKGKGGKSSKSYSYHGCGGYHRPCRRGHYYYRRVGHWWSQGQMYSAFLICISQEHYKRKPFENPGAVDPVVIIRIYWTCNLGDLSCCIFRIITI